MSSFSHAHTDAESTEFREEKDINFGLSWVIIYQLAVISIDLIVLDGRNRTYIAYANYLPLATFAVGICAAWMRFALDPLLFWTPITWFLVISSFAFGLTPMIYAFGSAESIRRLDHFWIMDEPTLLRTNVLNAVGIAVVCSIHMLASLVHWQPNARVESAEKTEEMSRRIVWRILLISLPVKWLVLAPMFFGDVETTVPGFLEYVGGLSGIGTTLSFFLWARGDRRYALLGTVLALSDAAFGMATFSKLYFILPFVQVAFGWYIATHRKRVLVAGFLVIAAGYMWVKPLVDSGRNAFNAKQRKTSDRVDFVSSYISGNAVEIYYESHDADHWMERQSFASTQAYLMNSYDVGRPGRSIKDFWIPFIPRTLWPDKPALNREGSELNLMIFGNDKSSLAATIFGEAYWNGGWPMVGVVSAYVGIVLLILGRLSIHFMRVSDMRWLPVGIMIIFYGLSVETWFVLSYVGTIPMFVGIWYLMKILVPLKPEP